MTTLTPDPIETGGIAGFAKRLRAGEITSEAATRAYLERIEALDGKLGAYECVASERAIATARAMDALLAAGVDLGPLMGVPVAVKDLFAVNGLPAYAGSNMDVSDLIGPQGSFVDGIERLGCVILGKTKTVEFALGTTGISTSRGTPWNPCDAEVKRIPGGSSSGSAVATAAGMCAFAIGSDTGGSVRLPAAFCGIFGLKTTVGLWPGDGVFPLSRELDSIGLLTQSAADATLIFAAIEGRDQTKSRPLEGLRLGRPTTYFYDGLQDQVTDCMDAALAALTAAGAEIVPVDVPEAGERLKYFPVCLPADLITELGRERFLAGREAMDPIVAGRGDAGLKVGAAEYNQLRRWRQGLCTTANARFEGLDGWVTPTIAHVAAPVDDFDDPAEGMKRTLAITQATQPVNLLDMCATTTPIQAFGADHPVGLQIVCQGGQDEKALAIALAIETQFGLPARSDVSGFVG